MYQYTASLNVSQEIVSKSGALCSALCGRDLMTTAEEEAALLAACVRAGGVDGVLGQPVLSVDGLPMGGIGEVHAPLRAALADFLIRCK